MNTAGSLGGQIKCNNQGNQSNQISKVMRNTVPLRRSVVEPTPYKERLAGNFLERKVPRPRETLFVMNTIQMVGIS